MSEHVWLYFCALVFSITSAYILGFLFVCIPGLLEETRNRELVKDDIIGIVNLKKKIAVSDILSYHVQVKSSTHTIGAIMEELEREGMIDIVSSVSPPHWIPKSHP